MQKLQALIDHLEKGRGIHISIWDLTGILTLPKTQIDVNSSIHSRKFCGIAKSTEKGYRLCLKCKALANSKAKKTKTPFDGRCVFGLHEAVVPVVRGGSVDAIVYVGNAIVDTEATVKKIKSTSRYSGVSCEGLMNEAGLCEILKSPKELYEIGEIVADYLKLLVDSDPEIKTDEHWLIPVIKRYIKENAEYGITISDIAELYQKNAQYLGRLFKSEVGVSFTEYCNRTRLDRAARMLEDTDEKIINIAYECGFNNVTYFNKVFQKAFGLSPTEYRNSSEKARICK